MASAEIIAVLNSDSEGEGDIPPPFGMDGSLAPPGWQQGPNAAGASAFQAIDLGSDNSDDDDSFPGSPAPTRILQLTPPPRVHDAEASTWVYKPLSDGGAPLDSNGASASVVPPHNSGKTNSSGKNEGDGDDDDDGGGSSNKMTESGNSIDDHLGAGGVVIDVAGSGVGSSDSEASEPSNAGSSSEIYSNDSPDGLAGRSGAVILSQAAAAAAAIGWQDAEPGKEIDNAQKVEAQRNPEGFARLQDGAGEGGGRGSGERETRRKEREAIMQADVSDLLEGGAAGAREESEDGVVGAEIVSSSNLAVRALELNGYSAGALAEDESESSVEAIEPPSRHGAGAGAPVGKGIGPVGVGNMVLGGGNAAASEGASSSNGSLAPSSGGEGEGEASRAPAPIDDCINSSGGMPAEGVKAESVKSIIDALPPGFVRCPGCPMVYELVPNEDAARGAGGAVAAKELPKGANLSRRAAMRHNGRHRFRCPSCSTCFCGFCRVTPYHIGFDCQGWITHQAKPKCTYCGDAAEEPAEGYGKDIGSGDQDNGGGGDGCAGWGLAVPLCCGAEECRERAHEGCRKKLECGHPCRGPGTGDCLPCIEPGCSSAELDGDAEFCNVCWTESLLAAPCVKLECGHFVHVSCGREQLQRGRPTARLTFGFMSCPVCRTDKALARHPHLAKGEGITEQLTLADEVEKLALQRLRADELPPLARSPIESLQAKMRRRMAGLARPRQIHGNPANWRNKKRGNPFPFEVPYPPMNPYNLLRRVRVAGRGPPMFPDLLPRGEAGALGDWQPFVGLEADWKMPPYGPMMQQHPQLYPPVPPSGEAFLRGGGAAGAAAGAIPVVAVGVQRGGAAGAGGVRVASEEEFLHRKRAMLIAQADVAMARAVAVGGVPGPREAPFLRARGEVWQHAIAPERSSAVRERIQNLEEGKAMIEQRKRLRRYARKELEELVMEDDRPSLDGFLYRPKWPRMGISRAPAAAAAGRGGTNAASARRSNGPDAKGKSQPVQGNALVPVDTSRSVGDLVDDPPRWPAARHLPLHPPPIPNGEMKAVRKNSMSQRWVGIVDEAERREGQQQEERNIDVGSVGIKNKPMGVWGWGVHGHQWDGELRQPFDDAQLGERRRGRGGGEAVGKSTHEVEGGNDGAAEIAGGGSVSSKLEKEVKEETGLEDEEASRKQVAACSASSGAPVICNRGSWDQIKDGDSDEVAPPAWLGVLPWRRLAKPRAPCDVRAEVEDKPEGKDARALGRAVNSSLKYTEDDEVVVLERRGHNGKPASAARGLVPLANKKRRGIEGVALKVSPPPSLSSPPLPPPRHPAAAVEKKTDGNAPDQGKRVARAWDDDGDGGKKRAERSRDILEDCNVAEGSSTPKPKRVHFVAEALKRAGWPPYPVELDEEGMKPDPWIPLDGERRRRPALADSYFGRNEDEEREAASAVVDAVRAAANMAANEEADGGFEAMLAYNSPRGGNRIDLAAEGMLRLHGVSPAQGRRGVAFPGKEENVGPEGVSNSAPASTPPVAPGKPAEAEMDVAEKGKKKAVSPVSPPPIPPPPPAGQTKENREEMMKRALKKYSFYQCHTCRKPYFGGLVSCEPSAPPGGSAGVAGAGAEARVWGSLAGQAGEGMAEMALAERSLADVKPQELLCGKCSAGSGGANCSEHGQEFMEHKCYWCCRKVASYFCGGVMHFCDVCHLRGFAAKSKPCLGGVRCLFGGAHPPKARNGKDEFVLGCGICRPKPAESEVVPSEC